GAPQPVGALLCRANLIEAGQRLQLGIGVLVVFGMLCFASRGGLRAWQMYLPVCFRYCSAVRLSSGSVGSQEQALRGGRPPTFNCQEATPVTWYLGIRPAQPPTPGADAIER